jgi:predicted DNA-binding transcriptional regulator YafY
MPRRPDNLETLHLSLQLLRRIPRRGKISAADLHKQVLADGFDRNIRTIQRQLDELSKHFDIERDESSKPYGYRWNDVAQTLSVPGLTEQESLLLSLAEKNLRNQLPAKLMQSMSGFFEQARRNLTVSASPDNPSLAAQWLRKVRVVNTSVQMIAPKVLPEVFEQVSVALYHNYWLDINYINAHGKKTQAKVMPLGLAQQGQRLFMPCRFDGYDDVRNLALHRIGKAKCTGLHFEPPADFDLKIYDDEGHFGFGAGKRIEVRLWLAKELAFLLEESPLSEDQRITQTPNAGKGFELTATVVDSALLVWWIRSQGKSVRVLGPQQLSNRI